MSSNFATIVTIVCLFVSAIRNDTHASSLDLTKEVYLALETEANNSSDNVSYYPPKLNDTYYFLGYTADENPFPGNASDAQLTKLANRANQVCVFLGNASAVSVILENHFDLDGLELALMYENVAIVELYKPTKWLRANIGTILIPTAHFKKLVCKTN